MHQKPCPAPQTSCFSLLWQPHNCEASRRMVGCRLWIAVDCCGGKAAWMKLVIRHWQHKSRKCALNRCAQGRSEVCMVWYLGLSIGVSSACLDLVSSAGAAQVALGLLVGCGLTHSIICSLAGTVKGLPRLDLPNQKPSISQVETQLRPERVSFKREHCCEACCTLLVLNPLHCRQKGHLARSTLASHGMATKPTVVLCLDQGRQATGITSRSDTW